MSLVNALFLPLVLWGGVSHGIEFGSKGPIGMVNDGVDPGEPLFLTPLIESGQLDLARQLSQVLPLPGSPVDAIGKNYAGFLTVNKNFNSNLYFWYFPAMVPEPQQAPVILWLQGGPGASSLMGLFVENGPVLVTKDLTLKPREFAWTSQFHVLYVDQPAGTGFSFTDSDEGYATNETQVANDLYQALLQFFTLFSELQGNEFYVTGESYGGKYVPAISYKLYKEKPSIIRFKGMAIGNGLIDPVNMLDYGDYLYQLGLLDELQRQHFLTEQDNIRNFINKEKWTQASLLFFSLILKPNSTFNKYTELTDYYNYLYTKAPADQEYFARYLALSSARRAIHVGNLTYNEQSATVQLHLLADMMKSTAPLVAELMEHYKVLIYSGQLDIIVAYPLTASFLNELQWSGADAFKTAQKIIWKVDAERDVEVAGYVRQVGNFTQVLVRNGGHILPYDQPRAAFDMINRFVYDKPFVNSRT